MLKTEPPRSPSGNLFYLSFYISNVNVRNRTVRAVLIIFSFIKISVNKELPKKVKKKVLCKGGSGLRYKKEISKGSTTPNSAIRTVR